MSKLLVVWRGPVKRASGLGIASREYVAALRRQGIAVKVGRGLNKNKRRRRLHARKVLIYHQLPRKWTLVKDRKRYDRIILNTVWETTRVPRRWVPKINKFDSVCVPTEFNRIALRQSGVSIPIYRVPHGVHRTKFKPGNPKYPLARAKGRFVFLSVFGFQHRKNPEALLRAYWEQFSASDKVLLIIKTNGYSPRESGRWIRNRIASYKKRLGIRKQTAPIFVIAKRLNSVQLAGLYALANAFVLPTRGEGVGLPFMEALSSGIPVIATGWGGQMDFLNEGNSFLVRYKLQNPRTGMNSRHAIARRFRSLFSGREQLWAEADLASLKSQLLHAYRHPELCVKKGRQGRRDMERYSWDRAGAMMKRVIEQRRASRISDRF
ncbi:glycosyltransferase [Cohnella thailandensis]|uniref:Glycosyltransferase n=1 Tax=Cohnella thailandensis TaxID=557557 RepID=A0A841T5W5_9BACL|nr:glycosyltransferase [Cohnella thailandensis]MBB6637470.1 glycosyltransferase [Cohnella thailandensis]MBP1977503.1 glycosyltransferase involved in cell wall biosynthesis [Cohnella thailandensis]